MPNNLRVSIASFIRPQSLLFKTNGYILQILKKHILLFSIMNFQLLVNEAGHIDFTRGNSYQTVNFVVRSLDYIRNINNVCLLLERNTVLSLIYC